MCMSYFNYDDTEFLEHDEEGNEICSYCKTGEYLTDLTEEDMQYLEDKGLL